MDIEPPPLRQHGAAVRARRRPRKPGQPKRSRRPAAPAPPMVFSSTPKRRQRSAAGAVAPPRDRDGPILFRNPAYRAGRESQAEARGINNGRPGGLTLRALEKYQGAKVAPCWVSRKEEEREDGLQGNVHQSRLRSSELFQNQCFKRLNLTKVYILILDLQFNRQIIRF